MPDLRTAIKEAIKEHDGDDTVIGLVDNTSGEHFQCGTCNYMKGEECHNPNPKLYGTKVEPEWCCNLYDHKGMKTIIE
jgi:hypothetical protein